MFVLIDDGTLDTVFQHTTSGEEVRFNYANSEYEGTYDEFVDSCLQDLENWM